jgi:hypothetical protein
MLREEKVRGGPCVGLSSNLSAAFYCCCLQRIDGIEDDRLMTRRQILLKVQGARKEGGFSFSDRAGFWTVHRKGQGK